MQAVVRLDLRTQLAREGKSSAVEDPLPDGSRRFPVLKTTLAGQRRRGTLFDRQQTSSRHARAERFEQLDRRSGTQSFGPWSLETDVACSS